MHGHRHRKPILNGVAIQIQLGLPRRPARRVAPQWYDLRAKRAGGLLAMTVGRALHAIYLTATE